MRSRRGRGHPRRPRRRRTRVLDFLLDAIACDGLRSVLTAVLRRSRGKTEVWCTVLPFCCVYLSRSGLVRWGEIVNVEDFLITLELLRMAGIVDRSIAALRTR